MPSSRCSGDRCPSATTSSTTSEASRRRSDASRAGPPGPAAPDSTKLSRAQSTAFKDVYVQVRDAKKLTVELERRGQPVTITYTIK